MACGAACVATDAGADAEVLENEAGVILNTQGVAGQLRTLLPQLREHQAWRKILAENARKRVKERYTLDDNIDAVEKLYLNLKVPKPIATGVA
jgi:glycosyltransferase involved in cell wall biosynthesis